MSDISSDSTYYDMLYERLRKHIEHEDNLINQRLSWFLGFQGLFIVAYGTILASARSEYYTTVLFILALVAFTTCVSAIISLDAASKSITELSSYWNKKTKSQFENCNTDLPQYPQLLYQGSSIYKFGQDLYPVIMMVAWIALSTALLLKYEGDRREVFYLGSSAIALYITVLNIVLYVYVFKQGFSVKQQDS